MRKLALKLLTKVGTVNGVVFAAWILVTGLYSIFYWFIPFTSFWTGFTLASIIAIISAYPIGWLIISYAKKLKVQSQTARRDNEIKNKLINILSHDVRSPLNNIKQTLYMLENNLVSNNEFIDLIKMLNNDIESTLNLTTNLVKWINVQQKGFTPNFIKFNLNPLIAECIKLYEPIAENKNISIAHEYDSDYEVNSDPEMIKILVRNLLSNAIKFSHRDGVVKVLTSINEQRNSFSMIIQDSGIGMSENESSKLLATHELQSQVGTDEEKGTGLGLSLCRTIIYKLKGDISVKSELGVGTSFFTSIPTPSIIEGKEVLETEEFLN